ncbi:MarR family winged helix-turn-helix transcriptional regulator [Pseudonocardia xishanensis]|uniref:HTH marR-type domain-containing protein n=1 Tax=Pseudonocardia xishanensis TaxID=630995 RepID=A0ABP8RPX0_9PSEU
MLQRHTDAADRMIGDIVLLVRLLKRAGPALHGHDSAGFPVLTRLAYEGPRRSGELAAAMCSDPSTVSRQVAALVKAGLVERRADPEDARASLVAVTAEGEQVLDAERRTRAARLTEALRDWTPEAREDFADLFHRFVADLQRQHDRQHDPSHHEDTR